MKRNVRCLFFIAVSACLILLPLFLYKTDAVYELSGVETAKEFPQISGEALMSGEFQTAFGDYLQQNLPGKPFLVRLRNQITFSVFHTVPNNNYCMNRERNLFTWGNVSAYLQYREPISKEDARLLTDKLCRLEQLLEENGRQLYLFITPCKVRFYEEELPWVDKAMAPERGEGDYERLIEALEGSGLNYFDSIEYMDTHTFDPQVPLFYDTNVHWSVYVGNCVAAAFGDYLEEKSGYNLPETEISAVPCETPVYPDSDTVSVFNLLEKPYGQYHEPVVTVTDAATDAPGMLCRGGSFMGQGLSMLIREGFFGKDVYMENTQLFTERFGRLAVFHSYEEIDLEELFEDIDFVILEVNEPSIPSMSFGFIDYLLDHPEAAGLD